jgi:hypothetical protein
MNLVKAVCMVLISSLPVFARVVAAETPSSAETAQVPASQDRARTQAGNSGLAGRQSTVPSSAARTAGAENGGPAGRQSTVPSSAARTAGAENGGPAGRQSTVPSSAAHTVVAESRPYQLLQSPGRPILPSNMRAPRAVTPSRMASRSAASRIASSRAPIGATDALQNQRALSGPQGVGRLIRGAPGATATSVHATALHVPGAASGLGTLGGGSVTGRPYVRGPAVVGGPPPAKIANSGTINGTAVRRRF